MKAAQASQNNPQTAAAGGIWLGSVLLSKGVMLSVSSLLGLSAHYGIGSARCEEVIRPRSVILPWNASLARVAGVH
jgi:hypothetical protein